MMTAAAIKARDQSLKEIVSEIPKEHRGRFMTICVNSIPDNVAFVDGMVVISILSKTELLDLDDPTIERIDFPINEDLDYYDWSCEIDNDDGRIVELCIDVHSLPADVGRLDRLKTLFVTNCRSLPTVALSKLPNLNDLTLISCQDLLNNFPLQMELNRLTFFSIQGGHHDDIQWRPSTPFLAWMAAKLPNLEYLYFNCLNKKEIDCFLHKVRACNLSFAESFKEIDFCDCNIDDDLFETLLIDTLPMIPTISVLHLLDNEIQSVKNVAERIKNDKTCVISKTIRRIGLAGNPVAKKLKNDPKEIEFMLSVLKKFGTVSSMEDTVSSWWGVTAGEHCYDSSIQYALRINDAGRILLEGTNDTALPLSVWPTLLERAGSLRRSHPGRYDHGKYETNHTGLYYLLRNKPALVGRSHLLGRGDNNDGHDGNKKKTCPAASKKKKRKRRDGKKKCPTASKENKCKRRDGMVDGKGNVNKKRSFIE